MNPIRIVLIENHALTWSGIRQILNQSGFDLVAETSTGKQGLAAVKRYRPDLALVGLGLPDLDGLHVAQKIKNLYPKTRVVILTSRDTKTAVRAAFDAGADSYCVEHSSRENLIFALYATHAGTSCLNLDANGKSPSRHQTITIQATPSSDRENPYKASLTPRELEVLQLIVEGHSNQLIAEQLYVTVGTVKTHVRGILNKLCVEGRVQAAVHALRSGLVF